MRKISVILILSVIVVMSCRKPIDMDLHNIDNKIVVNSFFSSDSLLKVNLSEDLSPIKIMFMNLKFIENATIKLYENNSLVDTLSNTENGNYISSLKPARGNFYKIIVDAPGYTSVQAQSFIPTPVPIILVDYIKKGNETTLNIKFKDPENEDNYYLFFLRRPLPNGYYSDDPVIGDWDSHDCTLFVFNDDIIKGKDYNLKVSFFSDDMDSIYNTYTYLCSITKDFYLFAKSASNQSKQNESDLYQIINNGLAEPFLMYSNIEDGIGIFSGHSMSVDSIKIE